MNTHIKNIFYIITKYLRGVCFANVYECWIPSAQCALLLLWSPWFGQMNVEDN